MGGEGLETYSFSSGFPFAYWRIRENLFESPPQAEQSACSCLKKYARFARYFVEMLSKSWNSLEDYVNTWYPLIKSLEQKRLEARRYDTRYENVAIMSNKF